MRTHTMAGRPGIWLTSERVRVNGGGATEIIYQVLGHKVTGLDNSTLWLDEINNNVGGRTKRQVRADEDAKAVGGLRSRHKAVANWTSAENQGK